MTFTFTVVDEVITSKACGSWPRHRNRSKIICFVFSLSAGILKCYFRTFITPPFIWQYERLNGFKTSFLKLIFQKLTIKSLNCNLLSGLAFVTSVVKFLPLNLCWRSIRNNFMKMQVWGFPIYLANVDRKRYGLAIF